MAGEELSNKQLALRFEFSDLKTHKKRVPKNRLFFANFYPLYWIKNDKFFTTDSDSETKKSFREKIY